jgi:hypothetical protein
MSNLDPRAKYLLLQEAMKHFEDGHEMLSHIMNETVKECAELNRIEHDKQLMQINLETKNVKSEEEKTLANHLKWLARRLFGMM